MGHSRLQLPMENCLSVTTLSRALNFGLYACIAVQLLYNQRLFLVSSSDNIVTAYTLVGGIKYWWKIQSLLDSGMEFFFPQPETNLFVTWFLRKLCDEYSKTVWIYQGNILATTIKVSLLNFWISFPFTIKCIMLI